MKRKCCKCNKFKYLCEFYNNKNEKFGKGYRCKDCIKKTRPSRIQCKKIHQVPRSLKNIFYSKVLLPDDNGCMIWIGNTNNNGYGHLQYHHQMIRSNRLSYFIFNGNFEENLHVLHTCDNRKCVAPNHLYLGTHQQNMSDRKNRKRGNTPKGESNANSKLTNQIVFSIREEFYNGIKTIDLAKKYHISRRNISYIVNNKTWKLDSENTK